MKHLEMLKQWRNYKIGKHARIAKVKRFKKYVRQLLFLKKLMSFLPQKSNGFTYSQRTKQLEMIKESKNSKLGKHTPSSGSKGFEKYVSQLNF